MRRAVRALIDEARAVPFDLDGFGPTTRWTWITPDAGWLVWDPKGTGRITSGRQLFGSVTFWVIWQDGYEALAALDDDHDGRLSGDELQGLALWRDADGDGRSDAGEVRPLAAWGVTALATGAQRHATGIPFNPKGATLSSGQVIPTYDLMPRAIPVPSGRDAAAVVR